MFDLKLAPDPSMCMTLDWWSSFGNHANSHSAAPAITIEVMIMSAVMLTGESKPTLERHTMFAVLAYAPK